MVCLRVEVIHCYVQAVFLQLVTIILFETDYCTFFLFFLFFSFSIFGYCIIDYL